MTARFGRAGVVAATLMVVYGVAPSLGGAQAADPTVAIDRTGTAAGEQMLITGTGWPDGATLVVELCGHGGLRGTVDCDVPHQRTAGVGARGTFSVELTAGLPPTPCPCVVKATDQASQVAATASIAVAGIPTLPITEEDQPSVPSVEVSSIDVTGGGRWDELFGAGGRRVLEVTLVNTGAVAVASPDVRIAWGSGKDPDGFVEPPETKRLEPGDTQILTVPLDRAALTIGEQTAVVEVHGLAEVVVARASTTGYPWALLVIALLLLQVILLRIRNRLRRRFQRPDEPVDGQPTTLGLPPGAVAELPAAPAVLDLREPVVVDVDATVRGDTVLGNGHGTNGSTANGHAANGYDAAESHRESTAALTADLLSAFGAASTGARRQVEDLQQLARRSLRQSADLSEALVAAARARADEMRATLAEQEAASAQRLAEAIGLLAAARARADELMVEATAAAELVVATAKADHEARRQLFAVIDDERDELIEAARSAVDRVVSEFDERTASLAQSVEEQAAGLLARASEERHPEPQFHDEFDRRLARAVSNAVNGT